MSWIPVNEEQSKLQTFSVIVLPGHPGSGIPLICKFLPESVQVCLFSATMPLEVLDLTKRVILDPICILVQKDELTLEGIKQFYIYY